MANTNFKQSVVAYKVRASDGVPVGLDGLPTTDTGTKQAIAILAGYNNPNPALYDVELTFNAEDTIDGEPTTEVSDDCATGYIFINVAQILVTSAAPVIQFTVTCSHDWALFSAPADFVTLDKTTGPRGSTVVTATAAPAIGQGIYKFRNVVTLDVATLYVIHVLTEVWVLQTGAWDGNGFWFGDSLWTTT